MTQRQWKKAGSKNDKDTHKAKTGPGRKKLGKKVDRAIGTNSDKITNILLEKTLNGDLTTTKLILSIVKDTDWGPTRRARKQGFESLAQKLAAEPRWTGECK